MIDVEAYKQSEHEKEILRLLAKGDKEIEIGKGYDLDQKIKLAKHWRGFRQKPDIRPLFLSPSRPSRDREKEKYPPYIPYLLVNENLKQYNRRPAQTLR